MPQRILVGDCRDILKTIADGSVQACITSPPYWGLRNYGVNEQLGQEETPHEFVKTLVGVLREVRRVLANDGTLWLNLGDTYAGSGRGAWGSDEAIEANRQRIKDSYIPLRSEMPTAGKVPSGFKQKDLIGIPWRVALALQEDGWFLRQDIIWHKPNPLPESVRDRCTKAHEYLFLLSKSERYYFDAEAISEPVADSTIERLGQKSLPGQAGSVRVHGKANGPMKAVQPRFGTVDGAVRRNRRSVWTIPTASFRGAHFATFPPVLVEPCIRAGTREGDVVLDPFLGTGTTLMVANRLGRSGIGIELNPEYVRLATERMSSDGGMFMSLEVQ